MGRYFITGIGTGVGKTFISAVLTEALGADYWKPVQCGNEGGKDSDVVRSLITNTSTVIHPESYFFEEPVSPHQAAANEGKKIRMDGFEIPHVNAGHLIIEGAGGMMVPLNDETFIIDLAREFEAEVILVCRAYLGCINHSLLSLNFLLNNDYPVKGMILTGKFDKHVKSAIVNYCEIPVLAEIPEITDISKESVLTLAGTIDRNLFSE